MHLVTVTCNRDFNQMLLQAESINKFLKPYSNHYVIVNEPNPDLNFWFEWLGHHYTNHKLHLLPSINHDYGNIHLQKSSTNGWITQQLQKLLISYLINDDYVILDSKNFFIRETDMNKWEGAIGSTNSGESTTYKSSGDCYAEYLGVEKRDQLFYAYTPFVIRRKDIVDRKDIDFFNLANAVFYPESKGFLTSEFTFYSYLVDPKHPIWTIENNPTPKTGMFFCKTEYKNFPNDMITDLINECNDEETRILGIHPRLLSQIDRQTLEFINSLLYSKFGLQTKLLPLPTNSLVK